MCGLEALRVVHGQAAHFQHPMKDPLQVKQRDIGGLAALLKEDSTVVKARSSDQLVGTAGAALAVAGLGRFCLERLLYSRTRWAFVTPTSRWSQGVTSSRPMVR